MRKRTILALALAGIALVVLYRRWSSVPLPEQTKKVSAIGKSVPGGEPIDRDDLPEDVDEQAVPQGVDEGTETLPGDETGDSPAEEASKSPSERVSPDEGTAEHSEEATTGTTDTEEAERADESASAE